MAPETLTATPETTSSQPVDVAAKHARIIDEINDLKPAAEFTPRQPETERKEITSEVPEKKQRNWNLASSMGRVLRQLRRTPEHATEIAEKLGQVHEKVTGAAHDAVAGIGSTISQIRQHFADKRQLKNIDGFITDAESMQIKMLQRIREFTPDQQYQEDPFKANQSANYRDLPGVQAWFDKLDQQYETAQRQGDFRGTELVAARTQKLHQTMVHDVRSLLSDMHLQRKAIEDRLTRLRAQRELIEQRKQGAA
jgi:hypothetical protein